VLSARQPLPLCSLISDLLLSRTCSQRQLLPQDVTTDIGMLDKEAVETTFPDKPPSQNQARSSTDEARR
jgi:hypothetical protein